MSILFAANVAAVLVAWWAVWECRLNFRSRWDSPKVTALALFGLGAGLDSPWRVVSELSFPATGRYYVLMMLGHLCFLLGSVYGIKFIYVRLLPDSAIGGFMKTRMAPLIAVAAVAMVVSFLASPLTRTMTADHAYLLPPDGWLKVYWLSYYAALTALLIVAMYGVNRLRSDPRSVMLNLLLGALGLGVLSCVASAWGVFTEHNDAVRTLAWPMGYAAITAGSVAVVYAWRKRVRAMLGPDIA